MGDLPVCDPEVTTEQTVEGMARSCHDMMNEPWVAPVEALAEEGAGPEYNMKASRVPRMDHMSKVSRGLLDAMLFCRVTLLTLTGDLPMMEDRLANVIK